MGELKNKLVFIVAIIFGLLTAGIIYSYITELKRLLMYGCVNILVAQGFVKTVIDNGDYRKP